MKNIRMFLSENFPFLVDKFSVYLNRRVFVMTGQIRHWYVEDNCAYSLKTSKKLCLSKQCSKRID